MTYGNDGMSHFDWRPIVWIDLFLLLACEKKRWADDLREK